MIEINSMTTILLRKPLHSSITNAGAKGIAKRKINDILLLTIEKLLNEDAISIPSNNIEMKILAYLLA